MNFSQKLKSVAQKINLELNQQLKKWRSEVIRSDQKLQPLADALILSCQGGKRIRGFLTKLGYELSGKSAPAEILKVASAVEIFETAMVVHDDIIDDSSTRRGRPTLHVRLKGQQGQDQALILADIGFFLAYKIISESKFLEDRKNKALSLISQSMIKTCLGELLDIDPIFAKKVEETVSISALKTAWYTFIGPLSLGAILAGDRDNLKTIEQFGRYLGLAYQIHDDILGVFGEEKVLGKSILSDVQEGKNTLLRYYAFLNGNNRQKQILAKLYGRKRLTMAEFNQIKQIFVETKALASCQKQALEYTTLAKAEIPKLTQDLKKQQLLSDLADFLITRQK